MLADQLTHPPGLVDIRNDEGDTDVGIPFGQLLNEIFFRWEIEHGCWDLEVVGDHRQTEAAMVDSRRKSALQAGHLIVEKLADVLFHAVGIIDGERLENGAEQQFRHGVGLPGEGFRAVTWQQFVSGIWFFGLRKPPPILYDKKGFKVEISL